MLNLISIFILNIVYKNYIEFQRRLKLGVTLRTGLFHNDNVILTRYPESFFMREELFIIFLEHLQKKYKIYRTLWHEIYHLNATQPSWIPFVYYPIPRNDWNQQMKSDPLSPSTYRLRSSCRTPHSPHSSQGKKQTKWDSKMESCCRLPWPHRKDFRRLAPTLEGGKSTRGQGMSRVK